MATPVPWQGNRLGTGAPKLFGQGNGFAETPDRGWPRVIVMASCDNVNMELRNKIANGGDIDLVSLKNPFHRLSKPCCEIKDVALQVFVEIM